MENEKIEICAVAAIHVWYYDNIHDKSTSNSERLVIIVRNIFFKSTNGTEFIMVFLEKLKKYNCDFIVWCVYDVTRMVLVFLHSLIMV